MNNDRFSLTTDKLVNFCYSVASLNENIIVCLIINVTGGTTEGICC